jgi:ribosomal protein S18 acetylase RimI-like enzyme
VVNVKIRVVESSGYTIEDLLLAFIKLYKEDFYPPHFYIIYDLLYELDNTEITVKLTRGLEVESYVLTWRYGRGGVIHAWGERGLELLQNTPLDTTKPHILELYSSEEETIEKASSILYSKGFKSVEVKWFHDMVCTEESFKPSMNEQIAVKLNPTYVEAFVEYAKREDPEITIEEARAKLAKRVYYGVFVGGMLVSAGAVCARLPELGLICDVYTREEYRRRGYATAVTSAATRRVVSSGAMAYLCVEEVNEEAVRIYRKLGYSILRTRPWIIAKPSLHSLLEPCSRNSPLIYYPYISYI